MKTPFLAVTLLAFSSAFALAAEDNSLSALEMERRTANLGGTTANPTAQPDVTSLSAKAMRDHPGVGR